VGWGVGGGTLQHAIRAQSMAIGHTTTAPPCNHFVSYEMHVLLCCCLLCVQACGADDELTEEDVEGGEVDAIAQRLTQLVQEVGAKPGAVGQATGNSCGNLSGGGGLYQRGWRFARSCGQH
jgi:hypothetical protein